MLSEADCRQIETTLLPTLERHHLRLLAHALRTLQAIAGRAAGPAPTRPEIERWAGSQPQIRDDPGFAAAFVEQLLGAARQLEAIAVQAAPADGGTEPRQRTLALDLDALVNWARSQADRRVAADPLRPASPTATPPPA
jgi:hypothetical protein